MISTAPVSVLVAQPAAVRRNRVRILLDILLVASSTASIAILVKLSWPGFGYWGDNANSFLPLWHILGSDLRHGSLLLFDHNGWGAANVAGEAAYGVFNPVILLNALGVSFADNLALAAFVVMAEFLVILSVGVYMLARVYGASRTASYIAAIIMPFAGFTLYYEAGNWASGLMSVTWVVHFWWAARAYTSGRMGPVAAFVFGGLAATVGNPYAVLGILIVLFGLGVELLIARNRRRLLGLVIVGACIGCVVVFTYLPLLSVLSQIDRPAAGTFGNTNYLTPSLGDLFGLSSPGFQPRMRAWSGFSDLVPSTYLAWVILPLLPWVKWRAFGHWSARASLLSTAVIFLLFSLGPDSVWLFRWPIRLIEYLYVCIAVLFALLVSAGLATNRLRRRLIATGLALLVAFFVAWSANPSLYGFHALVTVIIAALVAGALMLYRRFGLRGVAAITLVGTAILTPLQASRFGWSFQDVGADVNQSVPADLETVRRASAQLDGRVLQVASIYDSAGSAAIISGALLFGNTAAAAGVSTINRYTGINYLKFSRALSMDYRGSIDPSFKLEKLFQPVSSRFDVPLVDALGVDTLVIASTRRDFADLGALATGWHPVETSGYRTILQRDAPLRHPVISSSNSVDISDAVEHGNALGFTYSATAGGEVLLDRLSWTGYRASVDGHAVGITAGPAGLMQLDLPPGSGPVNITYEVPGLRTGLAVLILGLLAALAHEILWRTRERGLRRSWSPEIADPLDQTSTYEI